MNQSQTPQRSVLGPPLEKHPGLSTIDLNQPNPWGMGLVGLLKWLVWAPENIVGKRKTPQFEQIIRSTLKELGQDEQNVDALLKAFYDEYNQELEETKACEPYDLYKTQKYLHPVEATRRMRYFSEDFLNKEFDIFCSLLPSAMLNLYLQTHFQLGSEGEWFVFGNSNDLEFSMSMLFMQIDTLAYNSETNTLVGLELKIDADLGQKQVMKYCMMVAYLEQTGKLPPNTTFKLLVISANPTTSDEHAAIIEHAKNVLEQKEYPKRGLKAGQAETLHARTEELLSSLELSFTTWQDLGDYFAKQLMEWNQTGPAESCYKIIDGFLVTLHEKYSRKQKQRLYTPSPPPEGHKQPVRQPPLIEKPQATSSSFWSGLGVGIGATMLFYVIATLLMIR